MEIVQLMGWIGSADFARTDAFSTRWRFEKVLDAYPDSREVSEAEEALLEAIEDQMDLDEPDLEAIAGWPEEYPELMPLTPVEQVEETLETLVERLTPEQYTTGRLRRFEEMLTEIDRGDDVERELDDLEGPIRGAWGDYSRREFPADDISAESVGGHRYLEDGFQHWFTALELARRGRTEQAWEAAVEGNRLLVAVAIWTDTLRTTGAENLAVG